MIEDLIAALKNYNEINRLPFGVVVIFDDGTGGLFNGRGLLEGRLEQIDLDGDKLYEFIEDYKHGY